MENFVLEFVVEQNYTIMQQQPFYLPTACSTEYLQVHTMQFALEVCLVSTTILGKVYGSKDRNVECENGKTRF